MRLILIIFIQFNFFRIAALDLNLAAMAGQNGGSGSYLIYPSPGSAWKNPACIYPGAEISGSYLYSISSLPVITSTLSYAYKKIGIAACFFQLGHPLYKETILSLACSYDFNFMKTGLAFRQLSFAPEGYRTESYISLDGGLVWKQGRLTTGLSVKNIVHLKKEEISLPFWVELESCFTLSEQSRIVIGLEKQAEYDFSFRFTSFQKIYRLLGLLAGYQFEPNRLSCGISIELKFLKCLFSTRFHPYLDMTHFISIIYEF